MNVTHYATPGLRHALKKEGISVRDLAKEIGYSKSYLYNVMRGDVPCRRVAGERIAELLHTDFSLLFELSDSCKGGSNDQ